MAEKEQKSTYPLAPANGHARSSDPEEASSPDPAEELRKKKRKKWLMFIALFVIPNIVINTVFALTFMKARNPAFRVREATITSFNAGNSSLGARLDVQFAVKNTNFGRYKYRNATVVFMYRGTTVGEAAVRNSKVNWRSTKKFNVEVDLNILGSQLSGDLNAGIVPITSHGKLRGRAALMFVMKHRRSADMNCTMEIVRETQLIRNISCI